MTAHDLLAQLRQKGVEVKTSGDDRLVIDAPKGTVTEELRSALSAHKAELLQILNAEESAPAAALEVSEAVAEPDPVWAAPSIQGTHSPSPAMESESDLAAASTLEEINQLQAELM